jgi:cobalt-zinc-cadmium efflux system membrane fusion protein
MISFRRSRRALLLAMVAAFAACGRRSADESDDSTAAVVGATIAPVTEGPFAETVGALGQVAPRSGHVATLSAPAPTRVNAVSVSIGQHVKAGDELIAFDQSTFRAATQSADAATTAARRTYDRTRRLVDEGISARKDLDQATADLAKAQSDSVVAHRIEQLSVLRSPITGVVTRLEAAIGQAVDVAQPLIDIADPSAVDVILTVTQADAARMHAGDLTALTSGASGSGSRIATGIVADVAGAVDSVTHGVTVRVAVGKSTRELRIGESLSAVVTVAIHPNALTIPIAALVPEGDGFQVFVVDSASVAHAQAVTVGGRTGSSAEIAKGLSAGQRVVANGAFGVEDGAKIAPVKP